MKHYLIEMWVAGSAQTFMVTAKDYQAACVMLAKERGEATFKQLGIYEQMETNKKVMARIG